MHNDKAPEFDLKQPLPSAVAVVRAVLFSPKTFYLNFSLNGPVKEPTVFVLLVGAVASLLAAALALGSNLIFGGLTLAEAGATLLEAALFAALSPVGVAVVAGVYLLSIRTFIGRVAEFREVYRMAAYAYAVFVIAWIPLLYAFAVTYALMVLMGLGVLYAYRSSFMATIITVLVGFVPVSTALIWLSTL